MSDNYGRIVGVKYESSGGSMDPCSEFDIEVCEKEIIYTTYYGEYYFDKLESDMGQEKLKKIDSAGLEERPWKAVYRRPLIRRHAAYDGSLWKVLEEEFEELKPELKECPETTRQDIFRRNDEMQMLDGGDYSLLHLTWEKNGETRTAQYHIPSSKRWYTILVTLHEIARPVGRDLRRIGKRKLVNMYLSMEDYSYQISPISGRNEYYFFVYDGAYKPKSSRLSSAQWEKVREYLESYDFTGVKQGDLNAKHSLRLKYNDNDGCIYYLVDKKQAEQVRKYIIGLGY